MIEEQFPNARFEKEVSQEGELIISKKIDTYPSSIYSWFLHFWVVNMFSHFYFNQLFNADAKMFLFVFLPTKSWKNHPQNLLRNTHFFPYCPNDLTEEFMFQNVAYRPTLYKIGIYI